MAKKDAEHKERVRDRAVQLTEDLAPLGDVTSRSMFGGFGIFESGVMFAMVDSSAIVRLRADEVSAPALGAAGGEKFGSMPYWSIGDDVRADPDKLIEWATTALTVARQAKQGKAKKRKKS